MGTQVILTEKSDTSTSLEGRCDGCRRVMPARRLNVILVHPSWTSGPKWGLLCGPCFVDGLTEAVA